MYITNFIYDGIPLNSFGCIVCELNTSSQNTISNGSNIEFSTVSMNNGRYHALANAKYSEVLTATFTICKDPCVANYSSALTVSEISELMSWLTRLGFYELRVDADGYENLFFMGSFHNVQRVEFGGDVIGLTLEFTSNAPFAYQDAITEELVFTEPHSYQTINVVTDDLGEFYPIEIIINCSEDGDIELTDNEGYTCAILNCTSGEIISLEYPIINNNRGNHDIANDFNYVFPKLYKFSVGIYEANSIYSNKPCSITIEYNPIRKVGL